MPRFKLKCRKCNENVKELGKYRYFYYCAECLEICKQNGEHVKVELENEQEDIFLNKEMKNVHNNSRERSHILVNNHKRAKGREKMQTKCEESTQTNFWLPMEETFLEGAPHTNSQSSIAPNASSSYSEGCSGMLYRGTYFQKGDVVGLKDATDGKMYYAQIRSFLSDQCRETRALLTWLLPTSASPEKSFDPATYFLGPKEETSRKLNELQLICRFPDDHYRHSIAPNLTGTLKSC